MAASTCWSGSHPGSTRAARYTPVPARPSKFTCALHDGQEADCRRIVAELADVDAAIKKYRTISRRHPDQSKQLVEGSIRSFLRRLPAVFVGPGTRARSGGGTDEELDVTIVCREDDLGVLDREAYFEADAVPLRAHAEIKYRGAGARKRDLIASVNEGLEKLQVTIERAVTRGGAKTKTWTCLVLCGDGWVGRRDELLQHFGSRLRRDQWEQVPGPTPWWPVIDAVLLPSMILKKHELFERRSLGSRAWPILGAMHTSPHDPAGPMRPLAIARAFIAHHLEMLRGAPDRGAAWDDVDAFAITGPVAGFSEMPPSIEWHGSIGGLVLDPAMPHVACFAGDAKGEVWLPFVRGIRDEENLVLMTEHSPPMRRSGIVIPERR